MFWSLLESTGNTTTEQPANSWMMYIVLGVVIVIFIVWMVFSGRKNKQRQKEYTEQLEAIRPGHKVKTAGGICGIVVEVCDDNTVIPGDGQRDGGQVLHQDGQGAHRADGRQGPHADRARGGRGQEKGRGSREEGEEVGRSPRTRSRTRGARCRGKERARRGRGRKVNS